MSTNAADADRGTGNKFKILAIATLTDKRREAFFAYCEHAKCTARRSGGWRQGQPRVPKLKCRRQHFKYHS